VTPRVLLGSLVLATLGVALAPHVSFASAGPQPDCTTVSGNLVTDCGFETPDISPGQFITALAGNPVCIPNVPAVKTMTVTFGSTAQPFSFDTTGHSRTSLGWTSVQPTPPHGRSVALVGCFTPATYPTMC
jgi:hypothetical protein